MTRKSSLKISAAGHNWTVTISSTPGFCCSASTRIRGREFESRDCPYGFESAATDSLLSRVQDVYPEAKFSHLAETLADVRAEDRRPAPRHEVGL